MDQEQTRRVERYETFRALWYVERLAKYRKMFAGRAWREPIYDYVEGWVYPDAGKDVTYEEILKRKKAEQTATYREVYPKGYMYGPHISRAAEDELWLKVDRREDGRD